MRQLLRFLLIGLGLGGFVLAQGDPLEPGDPAPPFRLQGSDGEVYQLEQFAGKRAVVIAWFPKAFTGG